MQRAAWKRIVTRPMREQLHTTPVNTTWTADFLTLEGEGRKAMGDWLRDKSIPWKARRRLLLTNSGNPTRGTTGHLQNSVCRLQAPADTGAHNQCFLTALKLGEQHQGAISWIGLDVDGRLTQPPINIEADPTPLHLPQKPTAQPVSQFLGLMPSDILRVKTPRISLIPVLQGKSEPRH
jgi:hypothetical protein